MASGLSLPETQLGHVLFPILDPLQPGRKRGVSENDITSEETPRSESSPTLLVTPQSRLTRGLRNMMQHLFPCLVPREDSPIQGAQREGPETGSRRAVVTCTTTAQEPRRGLGKLFQDRFRHQPATDIPCPPEPLLSPEKFGRMEGKAEARAQARPTWRHPSGLSYGPCCHYNT